LPSTLPSVIYTCGLLIAEGLRLPHRLHRLLSPGEWQSAGGDKRTIGETAVIAAIVLGIWILPGVYIFTTWLNPFDFSLPAWVTLPATLVFGLSLAIRWKAQRDLGRAWSHRVELSAHHSLVTEGIYSRVRHPLYASLILWALAQPALLQNWIAGFAGAVAVGLIWFVRVPAEEAMLQARFGEAYRRYSARTGTVIPRRRGRDG
jgi:protein-S-isoprenylcysteine O-methyltransferase Ste14